ncbi:MAG: F0F1 ATP synthase subunit delta [Candidatus Phosphoribacter sp.]|nr:F0F1 ATP synthase subunit delta [Actinomycetales bacterium]
MQGSSRAAAAHGQKALDSALAGSGQLGGREADGLAEDLFGIGAALDSSATLRRALADPSREAGVKGDLVRHLLAGRVSDTAVTLVAVLAGQRWSTERDLTDTIEEHAVQALAVGAERAGRIDRVEDELFRFERIVAGSPELREAVTDRRADARAKAAVVAALLDGKAAPESVRLARQAVLAPRGRRFDRVIAGYLRIIATRRQQLAATVTSAIDLDPAQRERLAAVLTRIYGKPVHLNVVRDPQVVGGIRVQIGDEVVDGTVLRKLEGARRHFGG